jgi:hypothetical protein
MRKIPIIIIALVILIAGLLCGCTQDSNTGSEHSEDISHIMGSWVNTTTLVNSSGVNESFMRIYNFTDNLFNYSYFANIGSDRYYSFADGTYELKDGNLIVANATMVPAKKATFKYSFSNNYQILTLTSESGESLVYNKFHNPS